MGRMYSGKKGKAGSKRPVKKRKLTWIRYSPKEIEQLIIKLAKQGKSQSEIGMILRDTYGVPGIRDLLKRTLNEILVENKWNTELKSVFANLFVYNDQEQVMADIKSAAENIPSLSKKVLVAYWDTVGVEEGEYNGKLMVVHGQKSMDKHLVLKVSEDALDVFGVGYTIQPKGGRGIDMTTILVILVILLLVVNLAWFVFYRRNLKKK